MFQSYLIRVCFASFSLLSKAGAKRVITWYEENTKKLPCKPTCFTGMNPDERAGFTGSATESILIRSPPAWLQPARLVAVYDCMANTKEIFEYEKKDLY